MTRLGGPGDGRTDGPGDDLLSVAREIAHAVDGLAELWSVAAQDASLRLSPHQLRALRLLEAEPELNLTALAQGMGIGTPTASRLCDRLEAAGLVTRLLHPYDRREVRLVLTGTGRQVLGEVAGRRSQALAEVLAGMDPVAREALRRGLRAFPAAGTGQTGEIGDGPG